MKRILSLVLLSMVSVLNAQVAVKQSSAAVATVKKAVRYGVPALVAAVVAVAAVNEKWAPADSTRGFCKLPRAPFNAVKAHMAFPAKDASKKEKAKKIAQYSAEAVAVVAAGFALDHFTTAAGQKSAVQKLSARLVANRAQVA